MKSYRWEGSATALSSIAHGGETLGTITYLRREAFLTPTGRIDVPVISGNAVRGVLRDTGAHLLWNALGCPKLSLPVMHALWSGGALVKAKTQPLTGQRLADLRRMVAHIGVFGAAGGGRIIDGALTVGKLIPVCAQTAHVLPADLTTGIDLPDIHDLLQIERYSRVPDSDRLSEVLDTTVDLDEDPDTIRMRYGAETFIAGTHFHAMFALTNVTPDEHAFFADVLDAWLPTATVGGKTGRGHGRVHLSLKTSDLDVNTLAGQWRDFGGASRDEVLASLSWLD
jgi:hypothetical protein